MLAAPLQRTFTEAELLLIKEFTSSELVAFERDTRKQERGSRRIRHRGTGRSVEEAVVINKTIRPWGPLISVALRGRWIRNSRGETLSTMLAMSGTGAMHFTTVVEPHVLHDLLGLIKRLDDAPGLCHSLEVLAAQAWQHLSQDPKNADLPPMSAFKQEITQRLEQFVAPLIRSAASTDPYPTRSQAAANVFFCATILAISRARKRKLPMLENKDQRAKAITRKVSPYARGVFASGSAPATGEVPTVDDVEQALLFVEGRFSALGTDFPALFEQLRQDLI